MYVLRLKKTDARTQRRGFHEENGRMSAEPVTAFAEDSNVAAWQLEVSLLWALGIVVMILSGCGRDLRDPPSRLGSPRTELLLTAGRAIRRLHSDIRHARTYCNCPAWRRGVAGHSGMW